MRWNSVILTGGWSRWLLYTVLLVATWPLLINLVYSAPPHNGFELSNSLDN